MRSFKKLAAVLMLVSFIFGTVSPAMAGGLAKITDIEGGGGSVLDTATGKYVASDNAKTIYFGNYWQSAAEGYTPTGTYYDPEAFDATHWNKEGIKWRVLSNADGKTFLLSDQGLYTDQFNSSESMGNQWSTSEIRATLNNTTAGSGFAGDAFNAKEYAAIADTTHTAGGDYTGKNIESTDKIFLLSKEEAMNNAYGFTTTTAPTDTRKAPATEMAQHVKMYDNTAAAFVDTNGNSNWWLRSPGSYNEGAYYVDSTGPVYDGYNVMSGSVNAARPALNLTQDNVLFATAAVGGKGAVNVGNGFALADYDGSNGWKLTLKDDGIATPTNVKVTQMTIGKSVDELAEEAGIGGTIDLTNGLTVSYSAPVVKYTAQAITDGKANFVSAIVEDITEGSSTKGKYVNYAKISDQRTETARTVDFGTLADGTYKMFVFAEQANGDYQTDYASGFSNADGYEFSKGSRTLTADKLSGSYGGKNCTVKLGKNFNLMFDNGGYKTSVTVGANDNGTITAIGSGTTLTGNITVGEGATLTTVNRFLLKGAISGEGTIKNTGALEVNSTLAAAVTNSGAVTAKNGSTINSAVTNEATGATTLETGASFGTNGKITGGTAKLGSGVNFNSTNLNNVSVFDSADAVYNFNANVAGGTPSVDKIDAAKATGTLTLGSVSVTGSNTWAIGDTREAQYLTDAAIAATGTDLCITNTKTGTSDGYLYKFGQAKETDGTTDKIGWMSITKDNGYTLAQIVQNYEDTTQTPHCYAGNVATYALLADYTETENLGELVNVTGSTSRELTIQGNNHSFDGGSCTGIGTKAGDTLNIVNVKEISGWKDGTAFTNAGTLNISGTNALDLKDGIFNTGTVNLNQDITLTGRLEGNGVYSNTKTLTVENAASLAMTAADGLTNTGGTVNLGGGELGAKISGGTLNIKGDVTANAAYIAGNTNTVAADKTLALNGGTLAKEITGEGTTEITGNVTTNAKVSTTAYTIGTTGNLTTDVQYIGSNVTNNGTLTLTGGVADETISEDKFAKLGSDVTGEGTTIIDGYVNAADKKLETAVEIKDDKGLYIKADGIKKAVANEGGLYLADGTLAQNVTGGGYTSIRGNVEIGAEISQSNIVVEAGSLTTNADLIKGGLINNDTVTFTGGTLADRYLSINGTTNVKGRTTFSGEVSLTNSSTLNFWLDGHKAGDTIVETAETINLAGTAVKLTQTEEGYKLAKDETITLINKAENYNGAEEIEARGANGEELYKYTYGVGIENDALMLSCIDQGVADQTKSFSEARLGASAALNSASDLVAGQAIDSAMAGESWEAFAAMGGSRSRYETGSHVDLNSFNVAAGLSKKVKGNVTLGLFVEGGNGRYTTENEFEDGNVRADGDINYFGGGIFAKIEGKKTAKGQLHGEASFRAGHMNSDYNSETFNPGESTRFDTSNAYMGAHAGLGYKWNVKDGGNVDTYVKYLWNRQNGDSPVIDDETFDLDAINSHRLRAGFRYNGKENEKGIKFFGGLAYEYEFDGVAKGHMGEYALLEPDFKGGSGIAEIGFKYHKANSPWKVDLGLTGATGKRDSIGINLGATYEFGK